MQIQTLHAENDYVYWLWYKPRINGYYQILLKGTFCTWFP